MLDKSAPLDDVRTLLPMVKTSPPSRITHDAAVSEEDVDAARLAAAVVNAFLTIRPNMSAQLIHTFTLVMQQPGLTVSEYARIAGMKQSLMTRHLFDLSEESRHHDEGMGIITQKLDALDRRKKRAFLTAKGRTVAAQLKLIARKRA